MFLNIFTPYRYYYNAIMANCNDFWERLEVLEILDFLKNICKVKKNNILYKILFQNTRSFHQKETIHGNSRQPQNIQFHL